MFAERGNEETLSFRRAGNSPASGLGDSAAIVNAVSRWICRRGSASFCTRPRDALHAPRNLHRRVISIPASHHRAPLARSHGGETTHPRWRDELWPKGLNYVRNYSSAEFIPPSATAPEYEVILIAATKGQGELTGDAVDRHASLARPYDDTDRPQEPRVADKQERAEIPRTTSRHRDFNNSQLLS